jgi:PAS domain S-box-containing protein
MRVLIIAHYETDYHLTQTCLASVPASDFELCWKPTLAAGLAVFESELPDVVLFYAPLPDLSTQAAVSRLLVRFPMLPLIVVLETEPEALPVSPILDTLSRQDVVPVLLGKMLQHVVERSQFQLALQESENRYHALLNHAHDAIFLLDLNGQHMDINQRAADLLGYTLDEANLLSVKDVSGELNASQTIFQRVVAGEELPPYERIFIRKDGTAFPVEINLSLVKDSSGEPLFAQSVIRDISERKQAEAALRESEARYRSVVEDQVDLICRYDTHMKVTFVNSGYAAIQGKHPEEIIGQNLFQFVPETRQANLRAKIAGLTLAHPVAMSEIEREMPDGTRRWHEWTDRALFDDDGNIREYQGVGRDITERKRAENELRFHSQVLEHLTDGVHIVSRPNRTIVYANPTMHHMFGYEVGELLGKPISMLNDPAAGDPEALVHQVEKEFNEAGEWEGEVQNVRQDGSTFWSSINVTQFEHAEFGPVWVTVQRDVTERKRQEALQQHVTKVLEMIAEDQSLPVILERLVRTIEQHQPDAKASILTLNAQTKTLHKGAAPSLPEAYNQAIEGIRIGSGVGSCGTGAYEKRLVIAEDIATDPLWTNFKELALSHNLQACWSHPFYDLNGDVLGTFALYYAYPHRPGESELELVRLAAHIAGLAIRSQRERESLKKSEAKQRALLQAIPDMVFRWSPDGTFLDFHAPSTDLLIVSPENIIGKNVNEILQPESVDIIMAAIHSANSAQQTTEYHYESETLDGKIHAFEARVVPSEAGETLAIVRDVTGREQAERELAALYNATSYLFQGDSVASLGQRIVEAVVEEFDQADCGLLLVDTATQAIQRVARTGKAGIQPLSQLTIDGKGLVPLAIRQQQMIYVADVTQETHYVPNNERTRSELVIPLKTQQGVIGVLDLQQEKVDAFSERDIRILLAYAERAAAALESMRLYDQINQYAATLEQRVAERTAALQRTTEQIEAIFNHSADAILLLDLEKGIVQANQAFHTLFDLSLDVTVGNHLEKLFQGQDQNRIRDIIRQSANLRIAIQTEAQARCGTAQPVDVEISLAPVNRSSESVSSLVCIIRDITDRKAAEQQLRYLASLQEYMYDAVVGTDLQYYIQSWNQAAERMFGWSAKEVIGRRLGEVLQSKIVTGETIKAATSNLLNQGYWTGEAIHRHKDGHEVHVLGSSVLNRDADGVPMGIIGVNHDITQRLEAERALQTKLREEQELQQYLQTLHQVTIELTAIEDLDEFYKGVVEMGLNRLGFDRMALFLYDGTKNLAIGTYGTDNEGKVQSEQHFQFVLQPTGSMWGALQEPNRFYFAEDRTLQTASEVVGTGWNAAVALWYGEHNLGWIVADNLIHHQPASSIQLEIMGQYGIYIAASLARRQAEQAMRNSEARYRLLAENVTDIISRHSPDGTITYITPSVQAISGYSPEELIGKQAIDFFHPDDRQRLTELGQQNAQTLNTYTRSYQFRTKDGDYIWLEATSHPIKDPITGQHVETIAVSRDVTERKATEVALQSLSQRLEMATQAGGIGTWEWDFARSGISWDNHVYVLHGLQRKEDYLSPEAVTELVHPDDHQRVAESINETVINGKIYDTSFRILHTSGEVRHLKANGMIIRDKDGMPIKLIGVMWDITDLKRSEESLLRALEREKELGELKSRFVSMASHEFRTPLATILATAESLSIYREKMNDSQINNRLQKINQQVMHMRDIMEDVLQLARMQAGRVEFKPSEGDLVALAADIVEEFDSQPIHQGRIHYTCSLDSLCIDFDNRLMRQVLANVLSNALKYSAIDKSVSVSLTQDDQHIRFQVIDHGIGIPPDDLKHLYEPFHRATNVGTISGTGLGLSIARQSVELHGGQLEVETEVNKGTQVTVVLPNIIPVPQFVTVIH